MQVGSPPSGPIPVSRANAPPSPSAQKPSASVLVNTGAGVQLGQQQVQSIVHLVSSSIEGMDATQVTVVDGQGNLLSAAGDSTGAATACIEC